jgi:hypothetical protein
LKQSTDHDAAASPAHGGFMFSQMSSGLVNGYLQRNNIDPTVGCASALKETATDLCICSSDVD